MKTNNIKSIAIIIAASASFPTDSIAQADTPTPAQRLEKGVFLQKTKKDINAAILEFRSILEDEEKAKAFGAEARYHLMQCYLSQGDRNFADKQFKALQSDYPANNRWVKKATRIMHKPVQLVAAPWQSGELLSYDIKLPSGTVAGQFMTAIEEKSQNGKRVWVSYLMRNAGMSAYSTATFDPITYKTISAYGVADNIRDQAFSFSDKNEVIITDGETGKKIWQTKAPANDLTPIYENDHMVQLMRTIPHQIGTEYKTTLATIFNSTAFPFNCKVISHEEITTSAGKYMCAKIETNLNQTFWISTDVNRYIVRINIGQTDIELAKISTWSSSKSETIKAPSMHANVTIPGGWFHIIKANNNKVCRIALATTDFSVKRGLLEFNLKKNLVANAKGSSQAFADEVIKKLQARLTNFSIIENSKSTGNIGEASYVAFAATGTQGKLNFYTYHVYAVGKKGTLALRLYHSGDDLEAVKAKAKKLIKGITIE